MRQHLFTIFMLLLVTACATRPPIVPPVKVGSRVQVNAQFDGLPNATRIDFQGGQRVQQGNLDKWSTYCRLYVYNRNQEADYVTALSPGSFEVTGVEVKYRSSDYPEDGYYAEFTPTIREIPAFYVYQVRMRLTSPDQPEVQSLNCFKKWATPHANQYPTLDEIRLAVGDLIEIIPLSTAGIGSGVGLSSTSI